MADFQEYDELTDLRYNPFTDTYSPKGYGYDGGVSPERRTIPSSAPYQLTAFQLIREDTPSTVNIETVVGGVTLTEVAATSTPGNNEYRVNYEGPRAGLIEFNSAQSGLEIDISYYGLGSVLQVDTYRGSIGSAQDFEDGNDGTETDPRSQMGLAGKALSDGVENVSSENFYSKDKRSLKFPSKSATVNASVAGDRVTIAKIPVGSGTSFFHIKVSYVLNIAQMGSFELSGRVVANNQGLQFTNINHYAIGGAIEVGRVWVLSAADGVDRGCLLQMELLDSSSTTPLLVTSIESIGAGIGDAWEAVTPYTDNSPTLPDGSGTYTQSDDWYRFGQGETELWTGNTSIANGATGYITLPMPPENRFRKYRVECSFISGGESGYGQMNAEPISPKLSAGYSPQDFGFLISTSQYFIASVRGSGEGSNPSSIQVQNLFGGTIYVQRVVGVI